MIVPELDFIADTSAIVRRLRKDPAVEPYFAGKRFAITHVTVGELAVGALKSQHPEKSWDQVAHCLRGVETLRVSGLTPLLYALVYHELEKQGSLIPVNDIWIAAVCLEFGLPLLARDAHFNRVPDLQVIPC